MSHRVGAFLLYHEALLHDQHSSFAECINAFFSLALIISYAYAYDRPAVYTVEQEKSNIWKDALVVVKYDERGRQIFNRHYSG